MLSSYSSPCFWRMQHVFLPPIGISHTLPIGISHTPTIGVSHTLIGVSHTLI